MTARILSILLISSGAALLVACDDSGKTAGGDTADGVGTDEGGTDGGGTDGGSTGGSDTGEPDWEEGCITVSGFAAGFASLADAVDKAGDGDTITLCEGSIDETVAITESLSLVGPGPELLTWTAPANQPGITVSGTGGVSLSGFTMISTRNGIEAVSASDLSISDVDFAEVGNTAIKVEDVSGLVVADCSFEQPPYGAVQVSGGDATLSGLEVSGAEGFGVHALDGAAVTVSDSSFADTLYSFVNEDGTVEDGFALWAESGAELISSGNRFTDNFLGAFAVEADLAVDGDTYTGGNYGIYSALGDLAVSGTTITDPVLAGIYHASSGETPYIADTVVTGDPEVVDASSYAVGIVADSAAISGLEIEGFNSTGLAVLPYDNSVTVDISDTTLRRTGVTGLLLESADAVLTEVSVLDHRLVYDREDMIDEAGSVSVAYGAAVLNGGKVDWTGGEISGSEYLGIAQLQAELNATDLVIRANQWAGIFNFYGALTLTGSTLSESSRYFRLNPDVLFGSGGVFSYYGTTTLQSDTFEDNTLDFTDSIVTPDPELPGATYYTANYQSQDVWSQGSPLLQVLDSSFTNGSQSLYIYEGDEVVISGNTWSEYNAQPLYLYNVTGRVDLTDNRFENIGLYAIYGYYSNMDIDGIEITGARDYDYTVVYTDEAGTVVDTETSQYEGWEFYCYYCDLAMENARFTNTGYQVLQTYYGSVELYDVYAEGVGVNGSDYDAAISIFDPDQAYIDGLEVDASATGYGLNLASYTDGAVIEGSNITITDAPRYGLYVYSTSSYRPEVSLTNLSISGSGEYGLYLSSMNGLTLEDTTISGSGYSGAYLYGSQMSFRGESAVVSSGSDGIYAYLSYVTLAGDLNTSGNAANGITGYSSVLDLGGGLTSERNAGAGMFLYDAQVFDEGSSFSDNMGDGIQGSASRLFVNNASITDNAVYGINLSGDDLELEDNLIAGNGSSGVYLSGSYDLLMVGNTVTDNGGYGLECTGTVGDLSCSGNDFSGNSLGETDGCSGCGDTGL